MLEALRQPEPARRPRDEDRPVLCPVPADLSPDEAESPELPFIEVGPQHSLDGSPDVLACPAPRPRFFQPPPEPAADTAEAVPEVYVRAVPEPSHGTGLAPELVAFHAPESPAGEQYLELVSSLLPAAGVRPDGHCPVLLFTSCEPGVGATTVVLNVAIAAARKTGRRVVVVDANLRQPAVADRLGLAPAPGLREVLAGAAPLDAALRPTEQDGLRALTAGLAEPGPGPRFVAETTRSLLRHLRHRADLVFLDGPCWDGRPDVTALATAADAVYVVLPEDRAESPQADALLQSIPCCGARLAGCVLSATTKEEG
jgi:Mrp family chromosome partitioning ATPase